MARGARAFLGLALMLCGACASDAASPGGNLGALPSGRTSSLTPPPIGSEKRSAAAEAASGAVGTPKRPPPQLLPLNLLNYPLPPSLRLPMVIRDTPASSASVAQPSTSAAEVAPGGASEKAGVATPAKPLGSSDKNLVALSNSSDVQSQEATTAGGQRSQAIPSAAVRPAPPPKTASASASVGTPSSAKAPVSGPYRPMAIGSIMITPPVVVDPGCAAGQKADLEGKCREVWLRRKRGVKMGQR